MPSPLVGLFLLLSFIFYYTNGRRYCYHSRVPDRGSDHHHGCWNDPDAQEASRRTTAFCS